MEESKAMTVISPEDMLVENAETFHVEIFSELDVNMDNVVEIKSDNGMFRYLLFSRQTWFLAHLCNLHGGLICMAFCLSLCPSVCLSG